jgi:Skp family chaperone for outer membrane proteins
MNRYVVLRALTVVAVTVLLFGVSVVNTAARADASSGFPTFGSVDLTKILSGYKKKADLDQQIQTFSQKLDAQFKQQVGSDMLSQTEQAELTALVSKDSPTSADLARITALQQQSSRDSQELATLQQKSNASAADQARLTALTEQHQAGQQALQSVADGYKADVQAFQEKLSSQLSATVKQAITTVAQQRGLNVVFDSQFAIYCSNEITDDVLKVLNK